VIWRLIDYRRFFVGSEYLISTSPFLLPHVYFTLDLLEEGWGWQRLVPYIHGDVDWPVFEEYLKEYFVRNDGEIAALCANEKPEKDGAYFRRNAAKLAALHARRRRDRDEGKPSRCVITDESDEDGQVIASDYVLDAAARLVIMSSCMPIMQ